MVARYIGRAQTDIKQVGHRQGFPPEGLNVREFLRDGDGAVDQYIKLAGLPSNTGKQRANLFFFLVIADNGYTLSTGPSHQFRSLVHRSGQRSDTRLDRTA